MKVTTQELEQCEVLMTIEIEPNKEQNMLKKAAKRISRQVNIPGFRRGKAPFNTIVRRFGWETVQQEALKHSSEKIVTEALEESGIEPYAQVQLEEVSWNPLVFKVKIPVKPRVELGDYRNIRRDPEPVEVTDEDVEESLKAFQEQNATWTPVERPSQVGDLISMSVTEMRDGKPLTEDEAMEYELVAPDQLEDDEPDLTTPLLGLSAGDTKTFTVTYPKDYEDEQYADQDITFMVEVSGVKVKELDPLDDDFAQLMGDFDTLEEFKEEIRESIKRQRQRQHDFNLGYEILEELVESAERLEWPPALEERRVDEEIKEYERRARQDSMTLDSYLSLQNKTPEELMEETRENVVARLKRGLVLGKIADLEKLTVSESEILEQAKFIADYSGGGDQVWSSILASPTHQDIISRDLLSNKVIHQLAAIAKGEAPEPGVDGGKIVFAETADDDIQATAGEAVFPAEATETETDVASGEAASDVGPATDTTDEDETKNGNPEELSDDETTEKSVTTKA